MNTELRKDCPMRHENGNCMPVGGFCTAVNNPICEALHNAYDEGRRATAVASVKHGQWLSCDFGGWGCSECSCWIEDYYGDKPENYTYCPHCGAKMEVVRE